MGLGEGSEAWLKFGQAKFLSLPFTSSLEDSGDSRENERERGEERGGKEKGGEGKIREEKGMRMRIPW